MLKLKLKEVSRKNRQVAAWWQPENAVALQWHRKSNWDLTQQLHKSNAEQLRQELHILLVTCVLAGSAPFGSLSWKHKIEEVFDTIGQFDLASGYIVERWHIRRFVCYQLMFVLIFTGCSVPITFLSSNGSFLRFLTNTSSYVLPNILSGISFVLYYTLLQGIYLRLHCLVESLEVEVKRGPLIRRAAIQQLRWQHIRLLHFTKVVNQTFEVSVLLIYVSSLINFNTNLFLIYKTIENPDGATGIWFSYTSLWLLLQIGKMFYILYFNHNVQQEHTSCLALLMKVRTDSDELLETIHHFILQLQTNVRAHVACGLFEMDYKLIPALLMTTASLFIFLLQYDITFKALHSAANGTAI
ncbi:putative gustatory receptor 59f [Drosophila grimshawi]|uniref:putative gustatory receptor 59f n=1 Tax=Drosophila grimshawi TaxID=7222 RepID=UPI0013EF305A|nr:putative gustatory receptor 59f [Drosophila grimshawi]